ncbi:hypothetical protein [Demequina sp. SO4-18]|uniref:hypothetical protein n=1 Tax=Demequina sp. SO4-18 TaxID=3401026 RepID=UPI003B5BE6D9
MTVPRSLPLARLGALGVTAVLLAACGSDPAPGAGSAPSPTEVAESSAATAAEASDPDPGATMDAEQEDAGQEDAGQAAGSGTVYGTAVVDGVEYELHELRRCEPADQEMIDIELELTGRGQVPAGEGYNDGDWVQIDVYVQQIAGADFDSVSWAGPEGVFGTDDPTEVGVGDGRVSGTAATVDSLTGEPGVTVTYDIEVPDEILDCRL